jgi:hypothetical protein
MESKLRTLVGELARLVTGSNKLQDYYGLQVAHSKVISLVEQKIKDLRKFDDIEFEDKLVYLGGRRIPVNYGGRQIASL